MNRRDIRGVMLVLAAVFMTGAAFATATDTLVKRRAKAGTPIVPGQWHADFSKVKKYAEDNGLPLMAVWSNGDECSHCLKLERCLNHTTFYSWMKESGIVFYFGYEGDKSNEDKYGGVGYNWCWKNQSLNLFPFVRYYWKAKKGTVLADGTVLTKDTVVVDKAYKGDTVDNYKDEKTGNTGGSAQTLKFTKDKFKLFVKPSVAKDFGGAMVFPDLSSCGLQVEHAGSGTASVAVPLVRTNDTAVANSYTNYLVITASGKAPVTNEVVWAVGESAREVPVTVARSLAVGSKIGLQLLDCEKKPSGAANGIHVVEPVENSPSNPYWIGERTATNLGWGEWTMDLAVAMNKVKTKGGDATLILVGGSQWCPDCVALDKWLLDTPEFKTWATTTHKIACVAIDVPKMGATTPSLLTYDSCTTSERFWTYNYSTETNEALKVTSGAGYLSRHGVPMTGAGDATATAVAVRNQHLLTTAVDDAESSGLCRPECISEKNPKTGKFKTGIPALILMRPDGTTIAGRIYQFNNVSPSKPMPELVNRLEELFNQMSDLQEESNDDVTTAVNTDVIGLRQTLSGKTLSAVDQVDYYALGSEANGQILSVRLIGESSAVMRLELVNRAKTTVESVIWATNVLSAGIVISYQVPTTNCFLKVSYPIDSAGYGLAGSGFEFTADGDTTCTYAIATDVLLVPQSEEKTGTITDGNRSVSMRITEGTAYRITNLDESDPGLAEYLVKGKSANIYIAQRSAAAQLKLTSDSFTYRIWDTGYISFADSGASVSERDGYYDIKVGRLGGGVAGVAEAVVRLDPASTNFNDLIVFDSSDANCRFSWQDGESTVYTCRVHIVDNPYSDKNPPVRFYLDQTGCSTDAGLGVKDFLLTIVEDDPVKSGKLALSAKSPLICKSGKVMVREGSEVSYAVARIGGTTGDLKGVVSGSYGEVSEPVEFGNRDGEGRLFGLTMPSLAETASVKLTVKGLDGAKVESSSRTLTYQLVSADAPQFVTESLKIDAVRYVAIPDTEVAVDEDYLSAAGELKIVKVSGSLPSNVKATISRTNDKITISGAPKNAGSYSAVYQVKKGSTAGLTVTIVIDVTDPAVKQDGAPAPLNDAIVKTRTVKDILVIDPELNRLYGLMQLTIPRTGKLSAKFRSLYSKSISYASKSWDTFDMDGRFFEAELVSGSVSGAFRVRANADGTVEVFDSSSSFVYEMPVAITADRPLTDFQGLYTVSLKQGANVWDGEVPQATGDGYVTFRMTSASQIKKGTAPYAGMLPNGKAFSGSAVLSPTGWDDTLEIPGWTEAHFPIFLYSTEDGFSGVLSIDRIKARDYGKIGVGRRPVSDYAPAAPFWDHVGKTNCPVPYGVRFEAFGGKYDNTENLVGNMEPEDVAALSFLAAAEGWTKSGYGIAISYDSKSKVNKIVKQSTGAAAGFSVSFSSGSGIVSGSFRLPFDNDAGYVTLKYRAIVLPGWGSANCISCGGTEEQTERPLICGTGWYEEKFYYEDALGRTKSVKDKRGCAVSVAAE